MASHLTVASARRCAISRSLFTPTTLQDAIDRLGFVQADPIRAPARAQDLILRHRVDEYRAGDLERDYSSLDIEEDYLYAYGFVARRVWNLLHPRSHTRMRTFERRVLQVVRELGEAHPAALEAHLGRRRVVNAWGGYSKATTRALEDLHYRGLVRIVRRERGIRIYKPSSPPGDHTPSRERLRGLVMVNAAIFAPAPIKRLQAVLARFSRLGTPRTIIGELVKSGELREGTIDGVSYVWPADVAVDLDVPRTVRLLAPFDPLVWDRARFEHFWGWQYRFEAYTPVRQRIRGYYALPLLWGDGVVGWANVTGGAKVDVNVGFVTRRPRDRAFGRELDCEIARVERFLAVRR
jgi:uncharacterized protein YcaQ